MYLIARIIEIAILAAAYGISTVSEFGYLEGSFSGSIADYLLFLFCRVYHRGIWRHCAAGALAITGGGGGPHRLCPYYVDRFLPLHRNESNMGR